MATRTTVNSEEHMNEAIMFFYYFLNEHKILIKCQRKKLKKEKKELKRLSTNEAVSLYKAYTHTHMHTYTRAHTHTHTHTHRRTHTHAHTHTHTQIQKLAKLYAHMNEYIVKDLASFHNNYSFAWLAVVI